MLESDESSVPQRTARQRNRRPFGGKKRLSNVVKVRFDTSFITHDYDAQLHDIAPNDNVIVETSKGPAMAVVTSEIARMVVPNGSLKKVLRLANEADLRHDKGNRTKEREAFKFALERVKSRSLKMKLIRVQYMHDGSKAIFYFSADGRVDFRDLVRDLANRFRTRIEMRQIGVRDGARMVGGIGSCGRELCCSTFLSNFAPVSIRMAKDQGLTLNPKKVSGMCGRLMCCLVYEQQIYRKTMRRLPRSGKPVETAKGIGVIRNVDVVQEIAFIYLDDGQLEIFPVREIVVLTTKLAEERRAQIAEEERVPKPKKREAGEAEEEYLWDEPGGDKPKQSDGKPSGRRRRSRRSRDRGKSGGDTGDKPKKSGEGQQPSGNAKGGESRGSGRRRRSGRGNKPGEAKAQNNPRGPKNDKKATTSGEASKDGGQKRSGRGRSRRRGRGKPAGGSKPSTTGPKSNKPKTEG